MRARLIIVLLVPMILPILGMLGYHWIEGWSLFDALYMAVITLTTVGFGEVHPLSASGRLFTMAMAMAGVFTVFFAATEVLRAIVSGEIKNLFGRQKMKDRLAGVKDHVIVCGFGRMGRLVCAELETSNVPYVVIDKSTEQLERLVGGGGIPLHGDATADDILQRAGIVRARALVTVVASDADNLYITMSARLLHDRLLIVARAEDERSESKLLRAGATRVVSPYVIGGSRVAHAVLRPTVVDFIELATRSTHLELQMEETAVAAKSLLAGSTVAAADLNRKLGIIVVGVKRVSGDMLFNPPAEAILAAGDTLIALGSRSGLDRLQELAAG